MKIAIVTRSNESSWGGDLTALYGIRDGLVALGLQPEVVRTVNELPACDVALLSNSCLDQRRSHAILRKRSIPYALIGFHEDFVGYYPTCQGFFNYVQAHLKERNDGGFRFSLERLAESPHVVAYWAELPEKAALHNYEVLRDALVCIAGSTTEAQTMHRDCPQARTEVVYWASDASLASPVDPDEFLRLTGFARGEYILQVGRFEPRKNQLASVLACRDLEMPLVFVATSRSKPYLKTLMQAVARYRRARTLLISPDVRTKRDGWLETLRMPTGGKLNASCLASAYQNAGLYLHPAFQELPGYTYLESVSHGTPTVASRWATIQDYFARDGDPHVGGLVRYVTPHDLREIEQAARQLFGKRSAPPSCKALQRSHQDMARDVLDAISRARA